MTQRKHNQSSSSRSSSKSTNGESDVRGPQSGCTKPDSSDALHLLSQMNDDERRRLLNVIICDPNAPLHGDLDWLLTTCLHAMRSGIRAFLMDRDRPANGGRLWAGHVLERLKQSMSWRELLKQLPEIPEAVTALTILSPGWQGEPLWIDDGQGGIGREPESERIRKAIRDANRHSEAKAERTEKVYNLVISALPTEFRTAFPQLESYLRIF